DRGGHVGRGVRTAARALARGRRAARGARAGAARGRPARGARRGAGRACAGRGDRRRQRLRRPRERRRRRGVARRVRPDQTGTGVAVSDPTGTIARPLGVVERAATEAGLTRVAELVREEEAERVVVGLPLTLRGERGEQARETEAFVEALQAVVDVPVESYDE